MANSKIMSECICHTIIGRHHLCPLHPDEQPVVMKDGGGKSYYYLPSEVEKLDKYRKGLPYTAQMDPKKLQEYYESH